MTQLISKVKEQLEYLEVSRSTNALDEQELIEAVNAAKDAMFVDIHQEADIPTGTCTDIFKLLLGTAFNSAQRKELTTAINLKRQGSTPQTASTVRKDGKHLWQSCMHYHKLLPKFIWEAMLPEKKATPTDVILKHVHHMLNLGLVYANETTYAHIALTIAMAMARVAGADQSTLHENDLYLLAEELKKRVRLFRDKCKMPHYGRILVFPMIQPHWKMSTQRSTTRPSQLGIQR